MLTSKPGLAEALDNALIGFVTAVNGDGQPQTSPVWFMRDGEDFVVYNRPTAPRLESIAANPQVAFNLRADRAGHAMVSLEGTAAEEASLPPAWQFPGYLEKYDAEIAHLGWTPESFSDDYSVGLRIKVTRVRAFGLNHLNNDGSD